MKLLISNFGFSTKNCDDDYVAQDGEAVFESWPTEDELLAAFPGRAEYIIQMERDRLAGLARVERDRQLREIYDAGTQMIRRELETHPLDPTYESQLLAKRTDLHAYARLLQAIPDQVGFPETVIWPEIPTGELS